MTAERAFPAAAFDAYVGIDYSGASTPSSTQPGLRVYRGFGRDEPAEVPPPPSRRKYWTRREVAEWLRAVLGDHAVRTLVGIDHCFSFPLRYVEEHGLPHDWDALLDDFCAHWPADRDGVTVESLRADNPRYGNARWRRLAEERTRAKSMFHFDVSGSVAKSTHAGLPWLRKLRRELDARLWFWPFDGLQPPRDRSVVAEVYPSLWSAAYPRADRTGDQHDAYATAARLRDADHAGELARWFEPDWSPDERAAAAVEGWILGLA